MKINFEDVNIGDWVQNILNGYSGTVDAIYLTDDELYFDVASDDGQHMWYNTPAKNWKITSRSQN